MTGGWSLDYEGYDPKTEGLREALCTIGNGYICSRGAVADSPAAHDGPLRDVHYPGTYLAGGYDRATSEVSGREIENEDLVNLPDWLPLTFRIDGGPWFRIDEAAEIRDYRQSLDLRHGILHRRFILQDADGRHTEWREERLVSMADKHIAAQRVTLTPLDWSGRLTIAGAIDGGVINDGVPRYRGLTARHLEVLDRLRPAEDTVALRARTRQSRIEVAETIRLRLFDGRGDRLSAAFACDDGVPDAITLHATVDAAHGEPVTAEKVLALLTSRDRAISEALLESRKSAAEAGGYEALRDAHAAEWERLWQQFDIHVGDGEACPRKLHVHIFHLLQTVSVHTIDLDAGVPPRGWHGEAYRGHIFWDELFIFPFLNLRQPLLTRALLRYRYRRLREARRAAREAGLKGAMFPWQSGSNGREESQQIHLNPQSGRWIPDDSHRQRHINAAIAYNIWHYWEVTEDHEFLCSFGAEMLLEIARFWACCATWNPAIGRYEIKGVMGPDEYHTAYPGADPEHGGLDNNAYTNVMVAWLMMRAGDVWDLLPPDRREAIAAHIGLTEDERAHWCDLGRRLVVPFHDDEHGHPVISQFSGYEDLEELDWGPYREQHGDVMRLDRILEAEDDTPNRYKASKQADALMLFYLFSAEELALVFEQLGYTFDEDLIPRTVDYYLKRTSHGSTLSFVTHAWVLARSDRTRSWRLLQDALDSDIADIQGGTTREGIHIGAMAGSVDILQRCYLGIDTWQSILHFNPLLPDDLERISVVLRYRRHVLEVSADHGWLEVHSRPLAAHPIRIAYRGQLRELAPGMRFRFRLLRPQERAGGVEHHPTRRRALQSRRSEVEDEASHRRRT